MLRRLLSVLVLVFAEWPYFQCTCLMVFSTLNLAYLVSVSPLLTRFENRLNVYNELCIALFSHLMTVLLDIALPDHLKSKLGWLLIGVASVNMIGNLLVLGRSSI